MQHRFLKGIAVILLSGILLWVSLLVNLPLRVAAQIPTGSIPTVTGSPMNASIVVLQNEQGFANLRSGPGTIGYDLVGMLPIGAQAPALGRSVGGEWVQIAYPGVAGGVAWVYKDLVEIRGAVGIVEPPPTKTPRTTPTIDPTLAAQFLVDIPPTRLPTYTPAPTAIIPTFAVETAQSISGRLPMGLVIIVLASIGIFGTLISFLRGR